MADVNGARPVDQHRTPAAPAPLYQARHASREEDHALDVRVRNGHRCWTINGDFLALQPTGVARYAREVTMALDELMSECHPLTQGLRLAVVAPVNRLGILA